MLLKMQKEGTARVLFYWKCLNKADLGYVLLEIHKQGTTKVQLGTYIFEEAEIRNSLRVFFIENAKIMYI